MTMPVPNKDQRGGAACTAPNGPDDVLRAVGVSKRFGATQALDRVDFTLRRGSVHALLGRNGAGKSTLIGLLTGLLDPDGGVVYVDGNEAPGTRDPGWWRQRIGCVHQRPAMVPGLSVTENLLLNRYPTGRGGRIRWAAAHRDAARMLDEWGIDVDPRAEAGRLDVQQRQLAEIACALSAGSRIVLLDEPTAELEAQEVERLFDRVRGLQDNGVSFVYISHHLEEIYRLCDAGTVLRDGRVVAAGSIDELPSDRVVAAMIGDEPQHTVAARSARAPRPGRQVALELRGLCREGHFRDVSLTVAEGECVGLAGLVGSGRNAVAHTVAGLLRPSAGEVRVSDRAIRTGSVRSAIDAGIGFLPEDRHAAGFVPELSVEDNITLSWENGTGTLGVVNPRERQEMASRMARRLEVVASSLAQPVIRLSGGNQQKVTLARAMSTSPKVLVLAHPTSGVDIASKEVLFAAVAEALEEGAAVLIVSDEIDELELCSTVHVMFEGRTVRTFDEERTSTEVIAAIEGVGGTHDH